MPKRNRKRKHADIQQKISDWEEKGPWTLSALVSLSVEMSHIEDCEYQLYDTFGIVASKMTVGEFKKCLAVIMMPGSDAATKAVKEATGSIACVVEELDFNSLPITHIRALCPYTRKFDYREAITTSVWPTMEEFIEMIERRREGRP